MASPLTTAAGWEGDRQACGPEIGGLLHDLTQPLTAIRALASAPLPLAGTPAAAEEAEARLRHIGELADWMTALLRAASAAAARQQDAPADAAAIVLEVVVSAAASFKGDLRCHPSGPAPVPLDPLELRRAVGNVVDNATRAAGPEGRVDVRVRLAAGTVLVEVEDDGPGFGTLVPRQTGRGLAVALAVVGGCGGALEIAAGRAGGGLVRLELPLAVPDRSA